MSFSSISRLLSGLILGLLCVFGAQSVYAAQVNLTWDAAQDSSVTGYKVYYGTSSRNYAASVDAKKVTTFPVTGLQDGTTYYFAVTAYNANGMESGFSNEVTYTTTAGGTSPPPQTCTYSLSASSANFTASGGSGSVNVTASGGCAWNSSSVPAWISVTSGAAGTGNGTFRFSVAGNAGTSSRTAALTIAGKIYTVTQAGVSSGNYTITASAGTGGLISPPGSVTVAAGGTQAFSMVRYTGYTVADVKVDGVSVGAVSYYIFSNVTANHTISVTFTAGSTYNLAVSKAGTGNGTVTTNPTGTIFAQGTSVTLTATPDASSTFTGWSGACSGTSPSCTLTMNGNATVTASFAAKSTTAYTITATAGTGGSLSPSGSVSVNRGASQGFTISANSGYNISDVKVDGVSVGAVTSYNFSNVTANHTIAATFVVTTYTLSVSKTGTGTGTVANNPSGSTFAKGTSVTLTATPNASSTFTGWSGACSGTSPSCTLTMNGNASVTASFAAKSATTYTITATAGTGGLISPPGSVTVAAGGTQAFSMVRLPGYSVADVRVDGVSVGAVSYYIFYNVTANHTILVTFK